ncbi:hypothetical protein N431DRAFT_69643 [Stipitochalara longipes BDJ]|nr:hypothetical protein N431DRAFT_69643 [Stipitochalara longipes BDJ]
MVGELQHLEGPRWDERRSHLAQRSAGQLHAQDNAYDQNQAIQDSLIRWTSYKYPECLQRYPGSQGLLSSSLGPHSTTPHAAQDRILTGRPQLLNAAICNYRNPARPSCLASFDCRQAIHSVAVGIGRWRCRVRQFTPPSYLGARGCCPRKSILSEGAVGPECWSKWYEIAVSRCTEDWGSAFAMGRRMQTRL